VATPAKHDVYPLPPQVQHDQRIRIEHHHILHALRQAEGRSDLEIPVRAVGNDAGGAAGSNPHAGATMIIRTERLLLREFTEDDWPAVLAYQRDPRYLRFYAWTERSEHDARALVQAFLDQQQEEPRSKFQLAITLDGEVIGNVGVRVPKPGSGVGDMGYELAPLHWGHGYATEAARSMLRFGFRELGLHRIGAHCIAENTGSVRVLTKLGMQWEGRLREAEYFKGRWWDQLLYGILRREWEAVRRSPL
jgi:[ribosomal protein S5]-alanine N-acetyltransferase